MSFAAHSAPPWWHAIGFTRAPVPAAVFDLDGRYLAVNDEYCYLVERTPDDLLAGGFADVTHDDDLAATATFFAGIHSEGLQTAQVEKRYVRSDGNLVCVSVHFVVLVNDNGDRVVLAQAIDVSEQRRIEQLLAFRASHDPATGLVTRPVFIEHLTRALARLPRTRGRHVAVLFCDLDQLKFANDTYGHLTGDALIAEFAVRLRAAVRPSDVVARVGGDEFAVLLEDVTSPTEAGDVAARILTALAEPFEFNNQMMELRASIGSAITVGGESTPESLLAHADAAMYLAKRRGRGRYEIFDDENYLAEAQRQRVEHDLRVAAGTGQLLLHYQPMLDLRTNVITGVEALLRWRDPIRGVVPALDFIDIAEVSGLLRTVTSWILSTACQQLITWDNQLGDRAPRNMYVNIGGSQIADDELVEKVANALREAAVDPDRLKLEITETQIFGDTATTASTVAGLKALGCHLVIDDFGTGYSSMSRITELPISELKIDRAFVSQLGYGREAAAIAASITLLGHNLRYSVVAEGIETADQLAAVTELGVDVGQGYLISPPIDPEALAQWLAVRPE